MPRPKLIYLVTEDWFFWLHRLPMARAARDAGFTVGVATRVAAHGQQIVAEGFALYPLDWRRGGVNPVAALKAIWQIVRVYRKYKPDLVHHVALKPALFGSIAARLARVPATINGLTGLGTLFIGQTWRLRLLRALIARLSPMLFGRPNSCVVLENQDDQAALIDARWINLAGSRVIRGSGVDIEHFRPLPEPPAQPVVAAYVGRMLEDKGIRTLVAAHQIVRSRGVNLDLLLAGLPDPENATSITETELRRWAELPGITWLGHQNDVRTVWAAAHIAVLASRREGLPLSLLEAAACRRAIIATDVPGCREIAHGGENALLVPPDDTAALAEALGCLAGDAALRQRFAEASRRLVESDLAAAKVGEHTLALYSDLLAQTDPRRYGNLRSPKPA